MYIKLATLAFIRLKFKKIYKLFLPTYVVLERRTFKSNVSIESVMFALEVLCLYWKYYACIQKIVFAFEVLCLHLRCYNFIETVLFAFEEICLHRKFCVCF